MTTLPTTQQLYDSILSNLQAEFSISINPFGLAFLKALAIVFSNLLWLYYLAIGILQNNLWLDTCDLLTLIRYGVIILGRNMFQATAAQYSLTITGSIGGIVPATMVFVSNDGSLNPGMLYQIVGGQYTMTGTTSTITVQALAGGLGSQLNIGDTLTASAPMSGVTQNPATVAATITAPIDAETELEYRTAVIEKVQYVPGSWSAVDYRLVGLGISGIKQTYAYIDPANSNEVNVYLEGEISGIPIAGSIITAYATAIDIDRPIGTFIITTQATPINIIAITITMGGFTPFTTTQKTAISNALINFVNSVHPFIPACDNVSGRNDIIATFNLNSIITQTVPGYGYSAVTFTVDGTAEVSYQCGLSGIGNRPYFAGTVIYI